MPKNKLQVLKKQTQNTINPFLLFKYSQSRQYCWHTSEIAGSGTLGNTQTAAQHQSGKAETKQTEYG